MLTGIMFWVELNNQTDSPRKNNRPFEFFFFKKCIIKYFQASKIWSLHICLPNWMVPLRILTLTCCLLFKLPPSNFKDICTFKDRSTFLLLELIGATNCLVDQDLYLLSYFSSYLHLILNIFTFLLLYLNGATCWPWPTFLFYKEQPTNLKQTYMFLPAK